MLLFRERPSGPLTRLPQHGLYTSALYLLIFEKDDEKKAPQHIHYLDARTILGNDSAQVTAKLDDPACNWDVMDGWMVARLQELTKLPSSTTLIP
jgi:hypothetical protein